MHRARKGIPRGNRETPSPPPGHRADGATVTGHQANAASVTGRSNYRRQAPEEGTPRAARGRAPPHSSPAAPTGHGHGSSSKRDGPPAHQPTASSGGAALGPPHWAG